MKSFNRILVDIDALAPLHPALSQAVDLARRAEAAITIVDVVEDVPPEARGYLSPRLEADVITSRTERLESAVAKYRAKGVRVETAILRGQPAVALIQEVLRGKHDLLVRYHGRDLKAERGFGTVDMQLLRKCPCAVWLVGIGEKRRPKHIMAAVRPERDNPVAREMNARIIATAAEMARLERGTLSVVTAWTTFGESLLADRVSARDLRAFVTTAKDTAKTDLEALVDSVALEGVKFRADAIKGAPEAALPRYAKQHEIDVIVMGTVGRSGLVGMIMGNTAERVLQRLRCSVLALKPAAFESPVKRPSN